MKKVFIGILFALCINVNAQSIVREGNTFKSVSSKGSTFQKGDTLVTSFIFEDSKGTKYPIIINRNSGSCYVLRKSSKTGKLYKSYMKPEISRQVAKELNITYKAKK